MDPSRYDAWYRTRKGAWISERETRLLLRLLRLCPGMSLLDVGSGTGHFTRRFADYGLRVTGLDPDPEMLRFARRNHRDLPFTQGHAQNLPFPEQSFVFVAVVTSLCFIPEPESVLQEDVANSQTRHCRGAFEPQERPVSPQGRQRRLCRGTLGHLGHCFKMGCPPRSLSGFHALGHSGIPSRRIRNSPHCRTRASVPLSLGFLLALFLVRAQNHGESSTHLKLQPDTPASQ